MMSIYTLNYFSKSGKINKFLSTSLKSVKETEKKTIKQTMTTSDILKSTEIKNRLLKMYREKDPLHKDELAKEIRIIETLY